MHLWWVDRSIYSDHTLLEFCFAVFSPFWDSDLPVGFGQIRRWILPGK